MLIVFKIVVVGGSRWSFRHLTLAWRRPGPCGLLGSESANGRPISSLSVSLVFEKKFVLGLFVL